MLSNSTVKPLHNNSVRKQELADVRRIFLEFLRKISSNLHSDLRLSLSVWWSICASEFSPRGGQIARLVPFFVWSMNALTTHGFITLAYGNRKFHRSCQPANARVVCKYPVLI